MSRPKTQGKDPSVRVIAGRWKGRRLKIGDDDIRPTPDRVRETLFNWLMNDIGGARCLDLFAGTGALGVEALSRGAAEVVFVDRQAQVARCLRDLLHDLDCDQGRVLNKDAGLYLEGDSTPFDLVFLDPPFDSPDMENLCTLLESRGWLAPGAYIYLESDRRSGMPQLPDCWALLHRKTAGQVSYALAQHSA